MRQYRRRRDARLNARQVEAAYVLYRRGHSLRAIARMGWERWGFASPHAAAVSLHDGFRAEGYPLRDRIEATVMASTTHGRAARKNKNAYRRWRRRVLGLARPTCAGVRLRYPRKGEPCRLRAMVGSDYCRFHDPELRPAVVEAVAAMRAARTAA